VAVAARRKILHGAMSLVDLARQGLCEKKVRELDEARKASRISNLRVVLCGEHEAQPAVNTGTPYG